MLQLMLTHLCLPLLLLLLLLLPAVVRYYKGEFYHEHYDNRADGPLTRSATILVYLCDTQEGGATRWVVTTLNCVPSN
jgi:hypothetical protein